ncbi:MAG: alpha-ketoacid dehydrogenase subunit beta [Planctomycetota bacterium]
MTTAYAPTFTKIDETVHPAVEDVELIEFKAEADLPGRDGARVIQYREALREAMSHEMRRDKRVFLIGEEVADYNGAYKISQGMLDEFGAERIIDSPISENGFAGMCIGAAMMGLRPIVEFMSWSFSLVAADQILNNAPKMLYMSGGQLGSTHSWCVEGMFANVPGLKMAIPSNPYDAKGLMATSIVDPDPVFFLESERMLGDKAHVPEEQFYIPFGRARLAREGSDVTLVSWGRPVHFCMEAAETLAKEGIEADVLDMRTVRPLDIDSIIASVKKTNRVVVVDQCWPFGSVASETIAQICETCFDWLDHQPVRVNTEDVPTPYAKNLEAEYLPHAGKVVEAVRGVVA